MKRLLLLLAFIGAFALGGFTFAQERVDLSVPILKTSTTTYSLSRVTLDWSGQDIAILLVANNGDLKEHHYSGDQAVTLMKALNKANLTTRSLAQRIFDRLIADGVVAGTVAGAVP